MDSILPEGFYFIYGNDINVNQIIDLREKIGWGTGDAELWMKCISESKAVVGVERDGVLAGVGFLAGNSRHAVLCDLVVDPKYQGEGLGKALLIERLRLADEQAIKYLYTDIADTNPMKQLYVKLGFKNTGSGLFRENT